MKNNRHLSLLPPPIPSAVCDGLMLEITLDEEPEPIRALPGLQEIPTVPVRPDSPIEITRDWTGGVAFSVVGFIIGAAYGLLLLVIYTACMRWL